MLFEAINVSIKGQDPGPELRQWVGCLNFEDEVMIFRFPVQSDLGAQYVFQQIYLNADFLIILSTLKIRF